jgi:hypothetical protein
MNINNKILQRIRELDYISDNYGIDIRMLTDLFEQTQINNEYYENAYKFISDVMKKNGKSYLFIYIKDLAELEKGIGELLPNHRDHVFHIITCFILGIYINETYMKKKNYGVDYFQWKLTSLFHDIGYPFEISHKLLKPISDNLNNLRNEIYGNYNKSELIKYDISGIRKLLHKKDSVNLIDKRLKKWGIDLNAKNEVNKMNNEFRICHGMVGSILLYNIIDLMYEKNNKKREYKDIRDNEYRSSWNQKYFNNDICDCCSAIFLHNLRFKSDKRILIKPEKAPLAFLLRLCDTIQEWNRFSKNDPTGFSPTLFDIEYKNDKLFILVKDIKICKEIKENISNYIDVNDIEVVQE